MVNISEEEYQRGMLNLTADLRDRRKADSEAAFKALGIMPTAETERLVDGLDFEFLVDLADRRSRTFDFARREIRRFIERAMVKRL